MNPICVTRHLSNWKESQKYYRVGSIKHFRLELDLESLRHLGDVLGHIIVVMLSLADQAI